MSFLEWSNWLHLLAALIWVGGLAFSLLVLSPRPGLFLEAAQRFKPWMLGSMGLILVTGFIRVHQMGGFKALPILIHVKIALAMVMMAISIASAFYLVPKAARQTAGGPVEGGMVKGLVIASGVNVALSLAILWLLARVGVI